MARRKKKIDKIIKLKIHPFLAFILVLFFIYISTVYKDEIDYYLNGMNNTTNDISYSLKEIPEYSNTPYVVINNNEPFFDTDEITTNNFERYSRLDSLGRCGVAYANVSIDTMPTEERGSIGSVKPSGWQTVKYNNIDGKYLYNRCHLIGYQLTGENANKQNLITCTRYMNVTGMLYFENKVADYVKKTNNHVMYRVTPMYEGDNLLASGVLMEALSVEDNGKGVCFNVYVYNVQPGIEIDYSTGASKGPKYTGDSNDEVDKENDYILNKSSMKFHKITCSSVETISEKNKEEYNGYRSELIEQGYKPCNSCNP